MERPNKNDEKYTALMLETVGREAEESLMSALTQSEILGKCYAYKSRVKSEEKLLEKKVRKVEVENKPDYSLWTIKDVVGIRFVTLFKREMPLVFNNILDVINHEVILNPNPFVKGKLDEVIVYSTGNFDETSSKIRSIMNSKDIELINPIDITQSKEGYSSIHIVALMNFRDKRLNAICEEGYFLPLEIQIRTVFEDAWGEIEHKYGYTLREGKKSDIQVKNPESVLTHLKILKKFSDACAEYADAIHNEAEPLKTPRKNKGKVISVEADQALLDEFIHLGVPNSEIEAYKIARDERNYAESLFDENYHDSVDQYLSVGSLFVVLADTIKRKMETDESEGLKLIYYYSRMNQAVCLLATNQEAHIKDSIEIYLQLEQEYKDYILLKMRLGQAYEKLGQLNNTLELYREVFEYVLELDLDKHSWEHILPQTDYAHIVKYLPVIYGYALWEKSRLIDNDEQKLSFLIEAYNVTQKFKDHQYSTKDTLVNNLLYYSVDIATLTDTNNITNNKTQEIIDGISGLTQEFCNLIDIDKEEDLENLDTICKAFNFVGNEQKTVEIVDKIIAITLDKSKNTEYSHDVLLEIAQDAYEIKNHHLQQGTV